MIKIIIVLLTLFTGKLSFAVESHKPISNKVNFSMSYNTNCHNNAIARSLCIFEAILNDIGETYKLAGGGGISSIKQDATWVYTVSISEKERINQITYTLEMSPDNKILISNRKETTKSFGHKK